MIILIKDNMITCIVHAQAVSHLTTKSFMASLYQKDSSGNPMINLSYSNCVPMEEVGYRANITPEDLSAMYLYPDKVHYNVYCKRDNVNKVERTLGNYTFSENHYYLGVAGIETDRIIKVCNDLVIMNEHIRHDELCRFIMSNIHRITSDSSVRVAYTIPLPDLYGNLEDFSKGKPTHELVQPMRYLTNTDHEVNDLRPEDIDLL